MRVCVCVGGGGGGGGGSNEPTLDTPLDWSPSVGTLIFSSYVGLGPASTVYQKNIGNIRKIFEIFATRKMAGAYVCIKIPPSPQIVHKVILSSSELSQFPGNVRWLV